MLLIGLACGIPPARRRGCSVLEEPMYALSFARPLASLISATALLTASSAYALSNATLLTLTGDAPGDFLGYSVASAGDVNGDGFSDVIVGAPDNDTGGQSAGAAYLYYGGPTADTIPDLTLTGAAAGDLFGASVASAGDVNG